MKNEHKRVFYKFGDNTKFDYIIFDTKADAIEQDVSKESLIYRLCGSTKVKISNYGGLPFGSFDLVLEKREKNTANFCGLLLVDEDDIEIREA